MPLDYAGNWLANARNLTTASATQAVQDWVGKGDLDDYYRVQLSSRSTLNLNLNGLSANANLQIIQDRNSNWIEEIGEVLGGAYNAGVSSKSLSMTLDQGAYFIRVSNYSGNDTYYNLFFDAKAVNLAPNSLQFSLNSTTISSTDTLSINSGWVFDGNGSTDMSRVDFKLRRADGILIDLADATSFTPWSSSETRWAGFNYNLNLSSLNLNGGNYTLWAQAFDKSGVSSNIVEKAFTIRQPNAAPTSLQFELNKSTFNAIETLSINGGWVFDGNGATDLSRVDFKLRRGDGFVIDIADATNFTPWSSETRWASFNYNLNFSSLNLNGGNYTLWAQAFDKSGAVSNIVEKAFSITANNAEPGNTLASAEFRNSAIFTRSDRVDASDKNDFYRFNIAQSGIFTANLTGLTGDADIRLIQDQNNNGSIDQGEVIAWQWERGTGSENIRRFLGSGTYFLEVMSYNQQASNYTVGTSFTAAATDDRRFSIGIDFTTGAEYFTQTMREAVIQAGKFWENIITHSSLSSAHHLSIKVGGTLQAWSNGGGTLASAGPNGFASIGNGRFLATQGISNVNIASGAMSYMSQNFEYFKGIMIHEFGHVLGMGTMWESSGSSLIDRNTATYRANTYAGWAHGELLGTFTPTAIRITTGEGAGSDYAHWDESTFHNEIMTSRANWNGMPTSQMTIAGLRDLGWNVNYGAAQAYGLASRAIGSANMSGTALTHSASLQSQGIQAKCGCSKHLAGNGFNTAGSSNLSQLIGIA